MSFLSWIRTNLVGADPESVRAYQTVLPKNIQISVQRDGDHFIAKIEEFGGEAVKGLLITEADDMESLVRRVNDLVYTKIDMPLNIRPYYGNMFKPEGYKEDASRMVLTKA